MRAHLHKRPHISGSILTNSLKAEESTTANRLKIHAYTHTSTQQSALECLHYTLAHANENNLKCIQSRSINVSLDFNLEIVFHVSKFDVDRDPWPSISKSLV